MEQLSLNPTAPQLCDGVTSTLVGDNLYVFGGYAPELLWRLHLPSATWTEITCTGAVPTPRQHHAASHFANHLLVTGGEPLAPNGASTPKHLSYYELSLDSFAWRAIDCFGSVPLNRSHHTTVIAEDRLYLLGGKLVQQRPDESLPPGMLTTQVVLNLASSGFYDLHIFDIVSRIWRVVEVNLPRTPLLWGHSAICYNDQFLLFYGGLDVSTTEFCTLDRYGTPLAADDPPVASVSSFMYIFDTETMTWEAVTQPEVAPTPRAMHAALACGGTMVVFGGFTVSKRGRTTAVNDCWVWDILEGVWTPIEFCATHWSSLRLLSCVYYSQLVVAPSLHHLYYLNLQDEGAAFASGWAMTACTQMRIAVENVTVPVSSATERDKSINPRLLADYREILHEEPADDESSSGDAGEHCRGAPGQGRFYSTSPRTPNAASRDDARTMTEGDSAMARELAELHDEVRRLRELLVRSTSRGRSVGQSNGGASRSRSYDHRHGSSRRKRERIRQLQARLQQLEESAPTSMHQSEIEIMRSQSEMLRHMIDGDDHPYGRGGSSHHAHDAYHRDPEAFVVPDPDPAELHHPRSHEPYQMTAYADYTQGNHAHNYDVPSATHSEPRGHGAGGRYDHPPAQVPGNNATDFVDYRDTAGRSHDSALNRYPEQLPSARSNAGRSTHTPLVHEPIYARKPSAETDDVQRPALVSPHWSVERSEPSQRHEGQSRPDSVPQSVYRPNYPSVNGDSLRTISRTSNRQSGLEVSNTGDDDGVLRGSRSNGVHDLSREGMEASRSGPWSQLRASVARSQAGSPAGVTTVDSLRHSLYESHSESKGVIPGQEDTVPSESAMLTARSITSSRAYASGGQYEMPQLSSRSLVSLRSVPPVSAVASERPSSRREMSHGLRQQLAEHATQTSLESSYLRPRQATMTPGNHSDAGGVLQSGGAFSILSFGQRTPEGEQGPQDGATTNRSALGRTTDAQPGSSTEGGESPTDPQGQREMPQKVPPRASRHVSPQVVRPNPRLTEKWGKLMQAMKRSPSNPSRHAFKAEAVPL